MRGMSAATFAKRFARVAVVGFCGLLKTSWIKTMAESKIYFTIKTEGENRVLFSVRERHGDLQIFPRNPLHYNPSSTMEGTNFVYAGEHFSIHQSPESPDGNLIKRTVRLDGQDDLIQHNFTHAVKRDALFAHVYTKRATKLKDDRYTVSRKVKNSFPLGKYDPSRFVLYYSVWIGPSARRFIIPMSNEIAVNQIQFTNFCLILFSSYGCIFSDTTGGVMMSATIHPNLLSPELLSFQTQAQAGMSETECFSVFQAYRSMLHNSYLQIISNTLSQEQRITFLDVMQKSARLGFVPVGDKDHAIYKSRLTQLIQ
jgi:hypothetical protein